MKCFKIIIFSLLTNIQASCFNRAIEAIQDELARANKHIHLRQVEFENLVMLHLQFIKDKDYYKKVICASYQINEVTYDIWKSKYADRITSQQNRLTIVHNEITNSNSALQKDLERDYLHVEDLYDQLQYENRKGQMDIVILSIFILGYSLINQLDN